MCDQVDLRINAHCRVPGLVFVKANSRNNPPSVPEKVTIIANRFNLTIRTRGCEVAELLFVLNYVLK